jgi:hypothetical protein
VVLALMITAASLPACSSSTSLSATRDLLTSPPDRLVTASLPALTDESSLLFHNSLQDAGWDGAEVSRAQAGRSGPSEILSERERIASLSEPNSGALFTLGIFALLYLTRRRILILGRQSF